MAGYRVRNKGTRCGAVVRCVYKAKHQIRLLSSQLNSKYTKLVDKRKQIKWQRHVQHIGQCDARSSNNKWQAEIPARRLCGWVTDLY